MPALARPQADLTGLARDRSRVGRIRLTEALIDQYLILNQSLSQHDIYEFGAFLEEIFSGSVPSEIGFMLASHGAETAIVPASIVRKLAVDSIDIAAPFLKHSPQLNDADLLQVIGLRKLPHQLAIAERAALSEAVGDALVLTGNPDVVGVLLRNAGAKLSRRSIDKCTDLARQIQALRLPLIQRAEFTATDAARLMWWLPRELRQIIVARFGVPGGTTSNDMGKPLEIAKAPDHTANAQAVADMLDRFMEKPPTEREADIAATWLHDRGAINPTLLVQVIRQRQPILYTALLAKVLRLPTTLIRKCITGTGGQLLAVLCKALSMDKSHFASTVMLLCVNKKQEVSPAVLESALAAYDRLDTARAQAMIRAWRSNPDLLLARI